MDNLLAIKEVNKRNYTMDVLKAIFAICIVFTHFPFPGEFGTVLSQIGISGVIFFLLISGYNAYDKDDKVACSKLLKRFKRNGILTLIVLLMYLVFAITERLITNDFDIFLNSFTNPWLFPRMIGYGDFEFIYGGPLWFLLALLYSYLILYILHRFKLINYAFYFIPVLLLFRIFVENYVNTFNADWHLSANFLAGALPIMLLGEYIKAKKNDFFKTPLYLNIILFVISTVFLFLGVYINVGDYNVAQVFKIISMLELFLISLKLPGKKEVPLIGTLGRKYSLYIYVFHFMIGLTVYDLIYLFDWEIDYLMQIVALIFVIGISILFYEVNNKLKLKIKSHRV